MAISTRSTRLRPLLSRIGVALAATGVLVLAPACVNTSDPDDGGQQQEQQNDNGGSGQDDD